MAVTVSLFNLFKQGQINGAHFVDFNSHDFYLTLHTSSLAVDLDTDEYYSDLTAELSSAGNYTVGGKLLTTPSVTLDTDNDFAYFDADDVTWTALTATFRYAVLWRSTGVAATSPLILLINFGADQSPAGVDFVVQWAAAVDGAIMKVA